MRRSCFRAVRASANAPNAQHKDGTAWLCHSKHCHYLNLQFGAASENRGQIVPCSDRRRKQQEVRPSSGSSWQPYAPCAQTGGYPLLLTTEKWNELSFWRRKSRSSPWLSQEIEDTLMSLRARISSHGILRDLAYLQIQKTVPKPNGTVKTPSSSSHPVLKMQHFTASLSDRSSLSSVNTTRVHPEALW